MATISQLEYIVAVDRLRHFGKAAESCNISQPSLSMQIQKVEEEFEFLIFDRQKKPIRPTPQGKKFIEQAKLVLKEHQKLIHLAQEKFNPLSGPFHLGIIPTLAPYILPMFLKEFSTSYPDVDLYIDEMKTQDIITALQDDRLDAAFVATPLGEKGLIERTLFYEPFLFYASTGHELLEKEKVDSKSLQPEGLWLLQDGHCFRNQVTSYCSLQASLEERRGIYFKGGNFETLRLILLKNKGYTLFPQLYVDTLHAAEKKRNVRLFKNPQPAREISLVHRRGLWKKEILTALEKTAKTQLTGGSVLFKPTPGMLVLPID